MIAATSLPLGGHTLRILCVDDNPDQADSEALFLRVIGFEARACYGGQDAILIAGVFLPDICLLDLHMPGMAGDELAARLRDGAGARPLILVAVTATGNSLPATVFDRQLLKPVEPGDLIGLLQKLRGVLVQTVPADLESQLEHVDNPVAATDEVVRDDCSAAGL